MKALLNNYKQKFISKYNKLAFKPYVINRRIAGVDYKFQISDPVAREWYDNNSESWPEMEYLKDTLLRKGDRVFECGPHHGITTCHIAKSVGPEGHVTVFEPSPFNCEVIKKNLKLNNIKNVDVINKAIGEKEGFANFSFVSNASIQKRGNGTYKVEVTTIDSYADRKPNVLKIDVEGCDVEALIGAQKVLKTLPKLEVEVHRDQLPHMGHTVQDVLDQIDLDKYESTVFDAGKAIPLKSAKTFKGHSHLFAVPRNKK